MQIHVRIPSYPHYVSHQSLNKNNNPKKITNYNLTKPTRTCRIAATSILAAAAAAAVVVFSGSTSSFVLSPPPSSAAAVVVLSGSTSSFVLSPPPSAAAVVLGIAVPGEETLSNIPQTLSGDCSSSPKDCKKARIQRPKSRKAEACTTKCVGTCIRGGDGGPGEGPLNIRRPIVVFKQGFRSRNYCLVECSDICNLIRDGDDGP